MTIRTRFAPSPTGMLHIGGARTALFSWLFARHHHGKFFLRIEDTDRQRSTDEATRVILDGLNWLGLDWDEEPVFQSANRSRHIAAVERLLDTGFAYRCYCSREDLDVMRERQRSAGEKPRYDGRCRQRQEQPPAESFVIRFRSPDAGETCFDDQVLGTITFSNAELDDLILMRTDGTPTYNLAVVVDDAAMGITHVIRGSDHLNNTPRQIQLYRALDLPVPKFAHIPLIHGPDGAKMSKRHGAVSITAYRQAGYLPEAAVNYLARLGWSHGDDEIFSRKSLVELFDLAQVGRAAAKFDQAKLDWLNAHYLRQAIPANLAGEVRTLLGAETGNGPDLELVITALQERTKTLAELADAARFFYSPPDSYAEKALKKNFVAETWEILETFIERAKWAECWNPDIIQTLLQDVCQTHGIKLGKLAQPIRILLAGVPVSPPIDVTLFLLGRTESLNRIRTGMIRLRPD